MSIHLGVSLGPSFAEYCLVDAKRPKQPLAFRRSYIPAETIAGSLRNFFAEHKEHKPQSITICSSLLEKILDTKLGGTVAQIVTHGFENWPLLRQRLQNKYFELQPQRTEPLASQDLIFGINERINSKGEVLQEPSIDELEIIAAKLKAQNVERICVNLLFADINSKHQGIVTEFFESKGFEVFSCRSTPSNDEILAWRKNLLNASLSGTFKDVREEILEGCEGVFEASQLQFFDGDSSFFCEDKDRIASSLFGPAQSLSNFYQDATQVLNLGLERWYLLKPRIKKTHWLSPWGPLAGQVPELQNLILQPTSLVFLDESDQLTFSSETVGFEPGPMSMGKAFKPTLFDILQIPLVLEDMSALVLPNGVTKFRDTLSAMLKNSKNTLAGNLDEVARELTHFITDQIGLQVMMEREDPKSAVVCTGLLARTLFPLLKQRWPEVNWSLCPYSREIEGMAAAHQTSAGQNS
jgi:hypothetical protein